MSQTALKVCESRNLIFISNLIQYHQNGIKIMKKAWKVSSIGMYGTFFKRLDCSLVKSCFLRSSLIRRNIYICHCVLTIAIAIYKSYI